uniref:Uncharacterized protein n=1 Tax=Rhizophora mucronata TaxID=61149 RepID=A0A2P2LHJ1_RHIMU
MQSRRRLTLGVRSRNFRCLLGADEKRNA